MLVSSDGLHCADVELAIYATSFGTRKVTTAVIDNIQQLEPYPLSQKGETDLPLALSGRQSCLPLRSLSDLH